MRKFIFFVILSFLIYPKNIFNIIITGNYRKSKLLGLSIVKYNRDSLALFISKDKVYIQKYPFNNKMSIKKEDLASFIKLILPKRIIFLGDENYVSNDIYKKVKNVIKFSNKQETTQIFLVNDKYWDTNAWEVSELLESSSIAKTFLVSVNRKKPSKEKTFTKRKFSLQR